MSIRTFSRSKHFCSFKIYEYENSYVFTTFKIGTRIFSHNSLKILNQYDYNIEVDEIQKISNLLKKDKRIYFLIKNPVKRFLSGAVQVTFEGTTEHTTLYSLAKWGSETYYELEFLKEFSKEVLITDKNFNENYFIKFEDKLELWKTWCDIVLFNIVCRNEHLSYYHYHTWNVLNKLYIIGHTNIKVIEDTDTQKEDIFREITSGHLPGFETSNSKWFPFLKKHILNDVDINEIKVSINPYLVTPSVILLEQYIEDELESFNKLKEYDSLINK